jgi:hypothetical protein
MPQDRQRKMKAAAIISALLAMFGVFNCAGADPTSRTNSSLQIKTIFVDDAKLTKEEVKDVLSVAQQCGVSEPAEIRTFHYLPGTRRGISVKSVERVKGVDITFDEIYLKKTDWGYSMPDEKAKKAGQFWAAPADKYTTHLRAYDFRKEKIRVRIYDEAMSELADKIIPLIAAKKVRYPDSKGPFDSHKDLKAMLELKPRGIFKREDGKFWLQFESLLSDLQFRFENGEVILEQVVFIVN